MFLMYDGNYPTGRERSNDRALCSHSDPPLIYSDLRRPVRSRRGPPLMYSAWITRWTNTHKHRLRGRGRDTIIPHTVQKAVWHQRTYNNPWESSTLYHWPMVTKIIMVVSQEEDRWPCRVYLWHSYYGTTENANSWWYDYCQVDV